MRLLHLFIVGVYFCTVIFSSAVFALSESQRNLFDSGIYWFDADAPYCDTVSNFSGSTNAEKAYNFFVSKGMSAEHTAGFVGNLQHESGLFPNKTQNRQELGLPFAVDDNVGYGIAQWTHHTRKQSLLNFAEKTNRPIDSLEMQLEFIWYELTGEAPPGVSPGAGRKNSFDTITADSSPISPIEESALEINGLYEQSLSGLVWNYLSETNKWDTKNFENLFLALFASRPDISLWKGKNEAALVSLAKSSVHSINARLKYANEFFSLYGGGGGVGCSPQHDGLLGTILEYAWPTSPTTDNRDPLLATPQYYEAVIRSDKDTIYNGGLVHNGIDCGGFVTLAMRYSGYDTQYNSYGGSTLWQQKYLDESPLWEKLELSSTADLRFGDVAVLNDQEVGGHTFIYMGVVPGFEYPAASSALDKRAPSAYNEGLLSIWGVEYSWYRKVSQ